jgi:predicted small lipoprotein YifL
MPLQFRLPVLLLAALPVLAGCARRVPVDGAPADSSAAASSEAQPTYFTVVAVNGYSGLVDVFAIGGGITDRLGTVSLGTPQTFRVPINQFPPGTPIQLVATPLGGRGRASSGALTVRPGETLEFTIGSGLTGSVIVR